MPRRSPERPRLWAARLLGAAAVAAIGAFAVDMPRGYFGSFAELTPFGLYYAALVAVGAVAGALAHLTWRRWAGPFTLVLLSANFALFVAPLATDPVIAGGVMLWHATLLARLIFPLPDARPERPAAARRRVTLEPWLATTRHPLQHLLSVSIVLTIFVVGFRITTTTPALVACGALDLVGLVLLARFSWLSWQAGSRGPLLLAVPLAAALVALPSAGALLGWIAVLNAMALVMLLARSSVTGDLIAFFYERPALLLAVSFALLIALGTLLLSFPAASAHGEQISAADALFTATSATCVTGLIVLDTPGDFSRFGHLVILLLIQVGGLNIMVLSAFAAVLLGRGLGLRGERALGEMLDVPTARTSTQLAGFIVVAALAIETIGAVLLTPLLAARGMPFGQAAWHAVFHSVSAFCNAGFALYSDSLIGFRHEPLVLLIVAALIVLGGLGSAVLAAAWARLRGARVESVTVHVRIVLAMTAVLLVGGTAWFLLGERGHSLAGLGPVDTFVNALFQAVSPRTAGFNSVDLSLMHPSTVLLLMALMFIGASPGGTGGGIKVTTAAVLLGSIKAISRGERDVILFRRRIALHTVYRSAAIAVIALMIGFVALVVLLATEEAGLQVLAFEAVSALGTVGLSLGATPELSGAGRLVIVVVMFIGRIGPLALALLLGKATAGRLGYPEARVMVG